MAETRFVYVTYIRTTPEALWDALLKPEFTRQFWVQTWFESDWTPGASWRLMIPDGRVGDSGEVLAWDPPRKLVLSWRNEFQPALQAEGHCRVSFELEALGTTVKLTLVQEIDRDRSLLIEQMSLGWPNLLASLKSLLETGQPLYETRAWPEAM